MIVPIQHVIGLSMILFTIGVIGLFTRRDAITIFLSVEIILNAANVAFVGLARAFGDVSGQVIVFFVIAVAAAEAAIGLSIVIRLASRRSTLNLDEIHDLKG